MLTVVSVEVAVVVPEVGPLEFTHRKLRSELEGALTGVGLRNKALECITGDDEAHFVGSVHPSGIPALGKAVCDRRGNDRVDQHEVAGSIKPSGTQGLLVDPKRKPTVTLELVARDGFLTQLERSSGEVEQVFLHVSVVAKVFDRVGAQHHLEEFAFLGRKRLSEHLFTEECAELVECAEVQRTIWQCLSKLRVDVLHVAGEVAAERRGRVDDVFDSRLDQVLVPDVSVDDLQDCLLKRDLRLQVAALEGCASLLHANTRAGPAQCLQLELVLSGSNNVRSGTNAAERGVIDECGSSQRGGRHGHLFNNGADHIRHIRQSAAVDGVDVGRFAGQNASDLAYDTVYVFAGEILNSRQRDTIIGHGGFRSFLNSLPTHSGKQQVQTGQPDRRPVVGDLLLKSAERFDDLFRFTSENVLHTEQQHRVAISFSLHQNRRNCFFIQSAGWLKFSAQCSCITEDFDVSPGRARTWSMPSISIGLTPRISLSLLILEHSTKSPLRYLFITY